MFYQKKAGNYRIITLNTEMGVKQGRPANKKSFFIFGKGWQICIAEGSIINFTISFKHSD